MATKLDLADAQFIGYHFGKREPGIFGLIENMGLTKSEWERWKIEYPVGYLTPEEMSDIDEYFTKPAQ